MPSLSDKAKKQPQLAHAIDANERLTHCPETGTDLDKVDIRKHVITLWPTLDDRSHVPGDAMRRRDLLLDEADRRDEDGLKRLANELHQGEE